MHHSLQIMFILPLMAGHLFWKATILGGLYSGFHCISISDIFWIYTATTLEKLQKITLENKASISSKQP